MLYLSGQWSEFPLGGYIRPYYYQNFIREIPVLIIWLHLWINLVVLLCVYVVCLCD